MKTIIESKLKLKQLIDMFIEHGYEIYLVGGVVRDYLLKREIHDFDFTTSAYPSEMVEMLAPIYKLNLNGLKHGTVGVIIDHEMYEITTFRTEGGYLDNRHPEYVKFVRSIYEDLARRDFTINALAISLKDYDTIIDYFDGLTDLKNKVIRTVLDPNKRFTEDALRILRCLRFASSLGFTIEEETKKSIFNNYKLLSNISSERIIDEVKRMVAKECFKKIFKEYFLVFKHIFDLKDDTDVDYLASLIDEFNDYIGRLSFIFSYSNDYIRALERLRFSNLEVSLISKAIIIKDLDIKSDADVRWLFNKYKKNEVYYGLLFKGVISSDKDKYIDFYNNNSEKPNKIKDLEIDGNDLKKLNIYNKSIGFILYKVLESVIEEKVANDKEKLIEKSKEIIEEFHLQKRRKVV